MAQVIHKDAGNLVCVLLDVHIWSGRRHLEKTDLVHSNPEFRKLPEKDLANLGSVKICDPEDIRRFHTIKGQAERVLRRAGLPILGAIGVPADRFSDVHDELVKLQKEFSGLAGSFIAAYDQRVRDWRMKHVAANPGWTSLFSHIPTATHVAGRIGFDFHAFRISAPAESMAPELNARFESQLHGLKGELMREVADEANSLITDYLAADGCKGGTARREYVTQKTIGPLKRAAAKLTSFRFIDSTIGPLADMIQEVLASLPPSGRIDGAGLLKVWSLARMLSTPRQAAEMAQLAQQGRSVDDLLGPATSLADASAAPARHWEGAVIEDGQLQSMRPVTVAVTPGAAAAAHDLSLLL
jgi:hypothetical protein